MEIDILILGLQYVLVLLSCIFIAYVAYQEKSVLCSRLLMYSIGVLVYGLSYTYELHCTIVEEVLVIIRFEYIGLCTATISAVLFVCELFHIRIKKWFQILLVVAYVLCCLIITSNEHHHLYYKASWLELREHIAVFRMVPGPFYYFYTVVTLCSMALCVGIIVYAWICDKKWKENHRKYLFLCFAAIIPFFFWGMRLIGFLKDYDLIPFGLFCSNAFFLLILYFFRYFDVAKSAKNEVLETLEEGILVCDEEGNILYENNRMWEIMQQKKIKTLADAMKEMIPQEEGEFRIGSRHYAVTESEVYEGNRVKGKTWCFIDMTQTKEKERQLKELHQEAMAANDAKSSFLANMSHEIRTPINTILGMDELILREAQNINVIEYAQNIRNEGKTLLSLINDVLDFAKIESGRMDLTEIEYEMSALLHDVEMMFSVKTEEKGLEFHVEVAKDIPSVLCGDEIRIKQILGNLLSNAVKYTEQGSIEFKVGWERKDAYNAVLYAVVKDSGIGIKKKEIDAIFERFKRLDMKKNSKIEGTGLGMSITAQLLHLMGGEISVESEYGVGSEFRIRIPQKIVDETPMEEYAYRARIQEKEKMIETFTAPKGRILVVDDNRMNRVVVKGLLKRTLLQIEEAESGAECLKKTFDTHYDVILMDHMMPEMDGVETLKRLRKQNGACRNTPVIVLTANAVAGVRDVYLGEGFDDYLSKPISGRLLETMLVRYLPEELVSKRMVSKRINVIDAKQKGFQPEEIRKVLAVERIDLQSGLEQMDGQKDRYRQAARMFAAVCEERLRMLHEYIRNEDVPAYVLLVQTVAHEAKRLGALELFEIALEQEKLGKEGNLSFLRDKFQLLSAEYQRVAQCYKTLFDSSKEERS